MPGVSNKKTPSPGDLAKPGFAIHQYNRPAGLALSHLGIGLCAITLIRHFFSLESLVASKIWRKILLDSLGESLLIRRAKFYELTDAGRKRLQEETESWNRLAAAMASALCDSRRGPPVTCPNRKSGSDVGLSL
jgi:hypothetical protein